jgi:hypothetical protein
LRNDKINRPQKQTQRAASNVIKLSRMLQILKSDFLQHPVVTFCCVYCEVSFQSLRSTE